MSEIVRFYYKSACVVALVSMILSWLIFDLSSIGITLFSLAASGFIAGSLIIVQQNFIENIVVMVICIVLWAIAPQMIDTVPAAAILGCIVGTIANEFCKVLGRQKFPDQN